MNAYQTGAGTTAKYPGQDSGNIWFLALGLGYQVGKVAHIAQKVFLAREYSNNVLKAALGGCLWFVAEISRQVGLTLDDVAMSNLADLANKKFHPYDENVVL